MSKPTPRVVAISFDSPLLAHEALLAAMRLQDEGLLRVEDAVLITRSDEGPAHVQETTDPTPVAAAVPSSLVGALIGTLVGGPIGFLIGGVLAGSTGAIVAKILDLGISDALIGELRRRTEPGHSLLALLVDEAAEVAVLDELHRFQGADLVYSQLPPPATERVRQALAA